MTHTPEPATQHSARSMLLMGLMMAGGSTVDAITATMLPITAKHFTGSVTLITVMVALNRIFGFVVQPYAAWKSDSYVSARGRRRPFLLGAWPVVFASLALLGALPHIVPEGMHQALAIVVLLFVINLVMQAGLDVCYGTGDPMYGDKFSGGVLGRATGVRLIVVSIVGVILAKVFIPLADQHEFWPYAGAMLFVGVAWGVATFFIREEIPADLPKPGRYDPLKPLVELRNPQTRNVAIVASAVLVALALTEMLHALFVTETLGFSKTVLGNTTTAGIIVSLAVSYPVGWLADRIGARTVLIAGFLLVIAVEAAFVFWVDDLTSLYVCLVGFKVAWLIVHVPVVPLMFHNTPPARRGSIFAAVQMTRAVVTSVTTLIAGVLADVVSSYRMCYLVAGLVCVVGLCAAFRLAPMKRAEAVPVAA